MTAENAKFPPWIRRSWPAGETAQEVKALLEGLALHTVCQSAHCPNQAECWSHRTATVLILGNRCSRYCRFCAVQAGPPQPVDGDEPRRVALAAQRLALKHMVITSVTRDDLPDGGAAHFARCVAAVNAASPDTAVELLTPDFLGQSADIATVMAARPAVFGHNVEMPERLQAQYRDPRFSYARSLSVLKQARELAAETHIKSGFMLGLGETDAEIRATLRDLLDAGCDAVAIGQYLQPTRTQAAVVEFVAPERFAAYEALAYDLGFRFAVAGPFVRSSYRSAEIASVPARGGENNAR